MNTNLKLLADEINSEVRIKGFWSDKDYALYFLDDAGASSQMIKSVKDAFVSQKITLVGTELSEAIEAMRKPNYEANGYGLGVKDSFADEIADAIIRILDLCGELEIDIQAQVDWKRAFNANREAKHNKEF